MSGSLGRFGALTKKNLLVISRSPITTAIRALLLPLLIILILSFSKDLFNSNNQTFGIGPPSPILSLPEALSHAGARRTVLFCDNGLTGGEISRVIKSLMTIVNESSLNAVRTSNATELNIRCRSSQFTRSICFAGVIFFSSPTEGPGGVWNYTLGADASLGGTANVDKTDNDAQIFLMPLQRAIDAEITTLSGSTLPATINQIQYTYSTEESREESATAGFLNACASFLGALFFLAMVPVLYHMTGFIATERELGMAALLDASGFSRYGPQLLRLSSTYATFAAVYVISWLFCGIILATVVFTRTNAAITIIYHLLNGLALCSFSLLGGVFFRKAQLSGIFVVVVAVVLALLAQLLAPQTYTTILALALLFPSANYTYMFSEIARWEYAGLKTDLAQLPPGDPLQISGATLWGFLVFQILVYPILAVCVERLLFGTSSKGYKFVATPTHNNASVKLSSFSKTYKPNFLKHIFKRRNHNTHAVKGLNLVARPGTITMLLGPNGCGKSTTLDAIAGLTKITNGTIEVDRTGGLGFAPQRNVLWDELTVEEHVRIFTVLKSVGSRDLEAEVQALIKDCDLQIKTNAKAKTLSGGQKRKLHLAIMFAGGSRVCCVDEVSTGVDPVSRRKIWDILLAKRQGVCIIMTTHFLDEADWLADEITIMANGAERAHGSSAELKHHLGDGYSVHVPSSPGVVLPSGIELIQKVESEGAVDYRVATSAQAATLINILEAKGVDDYTVSGPTIEELFLKMTTDKTSVSKDERSQIQEIEISAMTPQGVVLPMPEQGQHLLDGKDISVWRQSWFLFRKRCTILRRNWMPYFAAAAMALIGAAVTPYIFKQYQRLPCPQVQNLGNSYDGGPFGLYGQSLSNSWVEMVLGPRSKISNSALQRMVDLYNTSHVNYDSSSVPNLATFLNSIHFVETDTEFNDYLVLNQSNISPGGFFLSDPPVMAWVGGDQYDIFDPVLVQNLLNIFTSRVGIATSYQPFDVASTPQLIDFNTLIFVIIFGLVFSCYPAFFALYPAAERLRGVRSMQYSNGVQPAALWLAYWAFDTILILLISVVAIVILASATHVWFGLPYLFAVLLFHGMSSAMFSYIISMFARSPLAAWCLSAAAQVVLYFAVFAAYVGIQSKVPYLEVAQESSYVQWTVGIISPGANLQRALYVALGLYTLTCGDSTDLGDWSLYGGPIAYLTLQAVLFLLILLFWDNAGFSLRNLGRQRKTSHLVPGLEATGMQSERYNSRAGFAEEGHVSSAASGISASNMIKSFGTNKAVDDVSLLVPLGETFALLGPNGAGKSTVISLIRGDVPPSTGESSIYIDNTSVLTHRTAARSKIGVCPQFDATDIMTVRESLLFFARIRGVSDPGHNVAGVIAACGLSPWSSKLAQTLSGGTKRKLSLAQALVGNPKVLLLDEPSSSLDAASKRVLWSTLSALSKDRAVLLTTHSMEEAQVLADRVGIMSSRMLATGTVADMCRDDVYHVHLVAASAPHTTPEEIGEMMAWVRQKIPGANMDRETYCGQVRFSVTACLAFSAGRLFSLLESGKERLGVGFYSVGRTTLDEVFVRVVREHGGREENSHVDEKRSLWTRR